MREVFIVENHYDCEGSDIDIVCFDRESAMSYVENAKRYGDKITLTRYFESENSVQEEELYSRGRKRNTL
jgi:hypothetical protein